ncbi:hypothetical protein BU23DRAFT_57762 [Bimuria novae-zelandiae CBS 107.79]|uniref:Uncharacterized protein n=1 Tax=Bimuria novae-zelandiae CBS 107.79 TaxID=1447943 RepID=A0A6A5VFN1_9PLEO|nr:hypothetical protein BU23DRAFT_57762 [Bimuria novae-zelandiae CBS 107.79]
MEKLPSKTHGQRNLHPKPTLETLFENVKQKPQIYGLIIKAQMAREQGNSQLYGQPDASRAQERTEKEGGESTQAYARRENDASRSVFQAFMAVIAQAGRAQARTVPGGESTQAHAQPENDTALLHSLATIRADALREEAYSKAEAARCKASGLPTGDADALHTAAAIKSLHADVNHRSEYKRQVEKFHRTEYQRQTGQAHAPWEIPPEAPDFAYIVNAIDNALARPHFPRKFHGCTSDGHFVYKTHIQPLVLKIREVAAHPASAGFAVQWVALLALMHILRLLYFHKSGGGRVCNEVVDWYEADAGHPDGDEITAGMQAIFKEMDLVSSVWMRQGDGAAGVLVRELQDLCLVLRKEAAPQVYHGLKLVLEIHFRQRVVSMAVEGGVEGWGFEAMWIP